MSTQGRRRRALASFLERREVRLSELGGRLMSALSMSGADEARALDTWVDLASQLPLGFGFARDIFIVAEPPREIAPLIAGSPWYASNDSLFVVAEPSAGSAAALLELLALYWLNAARIRELVAHDEDLILALQTEPVDRAAMVRLGVLVGGSARAISAIESSLDLRRDLVVAARTSFDPLVKIHPCFDPKNVEASALDLAERCLLELPPGPFRLVISDSDLLIDLLSPYVRDLASALYAWGLENRDRLAVAGLAEALEMHRSPPHPDLAALVSSSLFSHAESSVLDERREAERQAGLHMADGTFGRLGWADLSHLVGADEVAVVPSAAGTLVVVLSRVGEFLRIAMRHMLSSRRVTDAAVVFSATEKGTNPIVPQALVDADDGFVFHAWEVFERQAKQLGMRIVVPELIDTSNDERSVAASVLSSLRRASVGRELPEDAWTLVSFFPRNWGRDAGSLVSKIAELNTGRLALATLLSHQGHERSMAGSSRKHMISGNYPSLRRFRA